jgi:hypothetical protein
MSFVTHLLRSVRAPLLVACALTLAVGCKKKEERNDKCEAKCVEEYAEGIEECDRQTTECLATCAGPDDVSCTWDCEDYQDECLIDFSLCANSCPCAKDVAGCVQGCIDGETIDQQCALDCNDEYLECSGGNSPTTCGFVCQGLSYSCGYDCEDLTYSSDEFVDCREGCTDQVVGCLGDCQ